MAIHDDTTVAAQGITPRAANVDDTLTDEHPGRYQLEGELGEGGIGRVYVALDTHMGRRVALKELLDDDRKDNTDVDAVGDDVDATLRDGSPNRSPVELRFVNEARITGQLEHPGIAPVYELGRRADDTLYYSMRLVKGRTLEQALEEQTLTERLELLHHFVDVCNTVAYAHDRGVIHRDLKPDNVMIGDFGETVVLDWGLAKRRGEKDLLSGALRAGLDRLMDASALTTVAGLPIGTPAFMSPEQALGELDKVDERSDVYSLGVILYQLLTGRLPFDAETGREVIRLLLTETAAPAGDVEPDCPRELAAIAKRAMRKDHERRYDNAGALARDVQLFMNGGLVAAHRYSPRALLIRWLRRNAFGIMAGLALVVAAAGAWWYRGVDDALEQRRVEQRHKDDIAAQMVGIFRSVAVGNLEERWLDVRSIEIIALRDETCEDVMRDKLVEGLTHSSRDVRRLAARILSAFPGDTRVVDALVGRLAGGEDQAVQIEVINALGIIGDHRADEAVREARWRTGEYSTLWTQTELAYRMIPIPPLRPDMDAQAWNQRGTALMWKSKFDEAQQAYDQAIKIDPRDPKPYNNRAMVRRRLGKLTSALADYDKVIELQPDMVSAYNNRGLLRRTVGDYRGALSDLDRVVEDGSLGVKALRNRSLLKRYMGDFDGAHADLQQALTLEPNDARTYAAIGSTWVWLGEWERALPTLNQAIAINDAFNYAILNRARVQWMLGRRVEARVDVDHVLRADPSENWARRMRAHMLMLAGDHDEAKHDLDHCLENECIRTESSRPLRHAQRAVIYHAALGHYADALLDMRQALGARPRNEDAFVYKLAGFSIAHRSGDSAQIAQWRDLVHTGSDSGLWYHAIARLFEGGDYGALEARLIDPSQRCALALAGGLAAERAGDDVLAMDRYRSAMQRGFPHELSCILAEQAVDALTP